MNRVPHLSQSVRLSASHPVIPTVSFVSELVSELEHRSSPFANQFIYQPGSAAMESASQSCLSISTWDEQGIFTLASHSVSLPAMPSVSPLDYLSDYEFPTCASQSIYQ